MLISSKSGSHLFTFHQLDLEGIAHIDETLVHRDSVGTKYVGAVRVVRAGHVNETGRRVSVQEYWFFRWRFHGSLKV